MFPKRYDIESLKEGIRNPELIKREVRRIFNIPIQPVNNYYNKREYGRGIDVMEEDWDNLIILDACRYDFFRAQNIIDGDLHPVVSRGSRSWEFMQGNFIGRELHDTIYITSNPYVGNLTEDVFYTVDPLLDRWQEDPGTVPPGEVSKAARDMAEKYPDKRLIIHFMQPHLPYIGDTAEKCRERINLRGFQPYNGATGPGEQVDQSGISWWAAVRRGKISIDETHQAYSETLDIVLDEANELVENIDGKSVITADHGEMLGERIAPLTHRRYGHPKGLYTKELRLVPWLEVPYNERRDTTHETPIGFKRLEQNTVDERLEALGYK